MVSVGSIFMHGGRSHHHPKDDHGEAGATTPQVTAFAGFRVKAKLQQLSELAKTAKKENKGTAKQVIGAGGFYKTPGAAVISRVGYNLHDHLDLDTLKQLREFFYDSNDQAESLDFDAFCNVFGEVLGSDMSNREELEAMFMKIDANSDGGVDWDEFTNFLLLVNEAKHLRDVGGGQSELYAVDRPRRFPEVRCRAVCCHVADVARINQDHNPAACGHNRLRTKMRFAASSRSRSRSLPMSLRHGTELFGSGRLAPATI